jgi:diketogulonate reductase-like aldo/keto reductase
MAKIVLNNGVEMPLLGFGVFQIEPKDCEQCVVDAIAAGYRLIDTAAAYRNETEVGKAIKRSGIPRDQLFVVSKLWIQDFGYESAKRGFELSLKKLGLEYLDMYLLHKPFGDYYGAWRALEELNQAGKIRAIGVSNFRPDRLVDLCLRCKVIPAVNQIEIHPFSQQIEAEKYMKEFKVQPMSWGPFAEGKNNLFQNEVLSAIGKKHKKTVAQVTLRWLQQRSIIAIPKSVHKERIIENFNVFDFELDQEDLTKIQSLDSGKCLIVDHTDPGFVKYVNSVTIEQP